MITISKATEFHDTENTNAASTGKNFSKIQIDLKNQLMIDPPNVRVLSTQNRREKIRNYQKELHNLSVAAPERSV